MGHLSFMKKEYQRLQGRLMKGNIGLPLPENPDAREAMYEVLCILFSPEDAELASRMPLAPTSAKKLAQLVGEPLPKIAKQLESMADRGIVLDLIKPDTDECFYVLPPPVVGFFEYSLMRRTDEFPQKKLAEAMERYMHGDTALAMEVSGETTLLRTLVHETALPDDLSTEILSYERASEIIRSAKMGAVSLCYCRHKAEHLDRACDTPQEICTSLNAGAEWAVRHGFGRKADTAELLDILDKARDMGLVQSGDNVKNRPTFICHCCGCCCEIMTAINTRGIEGMIATSNYIAHVDTETCKGCSRCARACPVHAISMHPLPTTANRRRAMLPQIDESICLGCGVCSGACRTGSMSLKARPQRVLTPETTLARIMSQALERGRFQHFLFETAGRPTLLRRTLAALASAKPVQKVMALDQVKSRFVREAIRRSGGVEI